MICTRKGILDRSHRLCHGPDRVVAMTEKDRKWATMVWQSPQPGPLLSTNKAGDLSNFGTISKTGAGPMQFGPTSVFSNKRDSGKL